MGESIWLQDPSSHSYPQQEEYSWRMTLGALIVAVNIISAQSQKDFVRTRLLKVYMLDYSHIFIYTSELKFYNLRCPSLFNRGAGAIPHPLSSPV